MAGQVAHYGGGWFMDRRSPTGGSSSVMSKPAKVILGASFFAALGTGSVIDDLRCLQNPPPLYGPISPLADINAVKTSAEELAQIRGVFSPTVSDLADIFGVSRQSIYNWQAGEEPAPENSAKLRDLAQAADIFSAAGVAITGILLKRKILEGKSLFEIVRDGGSAAYAADVLVAMVRMESEQREMMARRFAGRNYSSPSAESDFPGENDRS